MREVGVAEPGSRIGDRYRVEAVLGVGGMGCVYRVFDEATSTHVALKQARSASEDARQANNLAAAFEREYFTLAELAHPRVITVHDYGFDASGAYYTMELLDGSDLRERAPLPWRQACSVVRDIASSLALLHARKVVHRDLSPRNVRCTSDGRAKLIDFGAMTPFGPAAALVGTPAYLAPETLWGQPLDARTDLFALGALAYYALVGRHAYPAQRMTELRQLWSTPPVRCSVLAPDVPPALDALVMALLAIDPLARPATAAEVVSRLSAIASLPPEMGVGSAHGYLTTPSLVGRAQPLAAVSSLLSRTMQGRGGTVLVSGVTGVGRSRFLDSVALQTKLAGALTLQMRAAHLGSESLAVVRAAVTELIDRKPLLVADTLAPYAQMIAPLLADAENGLIDAQAADAAAQRARVLESLVLWFIALSQRVPLALLIDDFEACDGATASFVAELALIAKTSRILIVLAARDDQGARARAIDTLVETGDLLELKALSRDEVSELLRSIFGDAPNLGAVVDWVYRAGRGVPKHTMELAQHLLERGIAKLVDDVWHLPDTLRDQDLPESVEQATAERVQRLGPVARHLAQALSLVTPLGALDLPELVALGREHYPAAAIHAGLDELTRAEILVGSASRPTLSGGTIANLLRTTIEASATRALHLSLAKLYLGRTATPQIDAVAAYHYYVGGALHEANTLLRYATSDSNEITGMRARFAASREGITLHIAMLRYAQEQHLAPSEIYWRLKVLVQLAAVADPALASHAPAVLAMLERDTGLRYLHKTDANNDMGTRIGECFNRALAVFEATPENERGLHPLRALVELANLSAALGSIYARTWDVEALRRLPALVMPFHALPAMALVQGVLEMIITSVGCGSDCRGLRTALLQTLATPIEGVELPVQQTARVNLSYYLGLDLAMRGDARALELADFVETFANHVALAWHVRSVYYGHAGDVRDMERCKHHMEAQLLGDDTVDPNLSIGKVYTLHLAVRVGDLLTLSRELPSIDAEAERFAGWRPWRHYYRGAHHMLRGEPAQARWEFEVGITLGPPGAHHAWQHLAPAYVQVLIDSGEYAHALSVARANEASARAIGLALLDPTDFEISLGLAEAYAGEHDAASTRLRAALLAAQSEPRSTLSLGALHEAIARVARLRGDTPALMQHARLAAESYRKLRRPSLLARCERLLNMLGPDAVGPVVELTPWSNPGLVSSASESGSLLARGPSLRSVRGASSCEDALRILVDASEAAGGYLFGAAQDAVVHVASWEAPPPDAQFTGELQDLLRAHQASDDTATQRSGPDDAHSQHLPVLIADGMAYHVYLLHSRVGGGTQASGFALLRGRAGQPPRPDWTMLAELAGTLPGVSQRSASV